MSGVSSHTDQPIWVKGPGVGQLQPRTSRGPTNSSEPIKDSGASTVDPEQRVQQVGLEEGDAARAACGVEPPCTDWAAMMGAERRPHPC